jgi:DNA ligase-1
MPTSFRLLAELCERLEATKKRLLMIDAVADFLKRLDQEEVEPAVAMILGRPFPRRSQQTLDVSWATLSGIIERMAGVERKEFWQAFSKSGDIGSATKAVLENSKTRRQAVLFERALTIVEVRRDFSAIAETSGTGSREKKERLMEALFSLASPVEAKYLIRIFIGEMRTGFHEGLMEQTAAKTFDIPLVDVQKASMITGDVGEVASVLKAEGREGLGRIGFEVFRPVQLMLAQMADNVEEALKEHGGKTAFEYKYDGARVQIHKHGDEVRIFSRRLTDATGSLPEIVEAVITNVVAREAILEGEVVAVNSSGSPIPFQHLMRRFKRVYAIEESAEQIPVKLYLFDVLYLDGESLISFCYLQRRQRLSEIIGKIPLATQIVTEDAKMAKHFLDEALAAGHEGLMAKDVNSAYTPGIRGKRWLKIKPVLEPLDLVIVAAEYGYGRRHGWLSDYYLAARDAKTGEFVEVGKTFKGLTDAEIIEMTRRLKETATRETTGRVSVVPTIVVEVAYNEIQRSPKYKCEMALRFARITRIREDKNAEAADTIQRVREIYEKQFLKKGRYKTG